MQRTYDPLDLGIDTTESELEYVELTADEYRGLINLLRAQHEEIILLNQSLLDKEYKP